MSKKLKIVLIVLVAVFVVAASVLLPLLLIKKGNEKRLQTPANIEVIESQTLIVFKTSKVENAVKYIFDVLNPNLENIRFESDSEELALDFNGEQSIYAKDFSLGGVYTVQVYAEANNQIFNSYKSNPTEFSRVVKLQKPTLYSTSSNITWATIKNANAYEILISNNQVSHTKILSITSDATLGQETLSFRDVKNEFELEKGIYFVSVRATNDSEFYENSNFSESIQIEIK